MVMRFRILLILLWNVRKLFILLAPREDKGSSLQALRCSWENGSDDGNILWLHDQHFSVIVEISFLERKKGEFCQPIVEIFCNICSFFLFDRVKCTLKLA